MLCEIFWHLGTKIAPPTQTQATEATVINQETAAMEEEGDPADIVVEDFDADAELQCRIWNSLVRADKASEDGRRFTVDNKSLHQSTMLPA